MGKEKHQKTGNLKNAVVLEEQSLALLISVFLFSEKSFSSGKVALYALAVQASCCDPRRVSAKGSVLNLVQLLETKFKMELKNISEQQGSQHIGGRESASSSPSLHILLCLCSIFP